MASQQLGNVKIKVGQWTDPRDGQVKDRTRTIGKLMQNEKGHFFVIMNAEALSTQLFALARKKNEDSIILNVWKDEPQGTRQSPTGTVSDGDSDEPY